MERRRTAESEMRFTMLARACEFLHKLFARVRVGQMRDGSPLSMGARCGYLGPKVRRRAPTSRARSGVRGWTPVGRRAGAMSRDDALMAFRGIEVRPADTLLAERARDFLAGGPADS